MHTKMFLSFSTLVCCSCGTFHLVGPQLISSLYACLLLEVFMANAVSQAGDADSSRAPGLNPLFPGVFEYPPWYSIVCATVTMHGFFCIFRLQTFVTSVSLRLNLTPFWKFNDRSRTPFCSRNTPFEYGI